MADKDLLELLRSATKSESNKGLTELYRRHYHVAASYVLKNSGSKEDAEDVFQDGLIALFEQVRNGSFMEHSTIKTYLFAICRNLWLKRLRSKSIKLEVGEIDSEMMDQAALAVDNIICDEATSKLADLIDELGSDCKKTLLLFYYEKKRMKEIAQIIGFANEQVAKNKKNKCLNRLRILAQRFPFLNPFFN